MNVSTVQKTTLDNYFTHLKQYGYMDIRRTNQVVFSVLLLDAVNMFGEYTTDSFRRDVDKIMRKLDCCGCAITWGSENQVTPFYIMGQYNTGVPTHLHLIADVIGLQAMLDELQAKIKKVDAKANAGL